MTPLNALRNAIETRGLDGFFLPHSDAFRSESLRECDKRLAHITGFTGSAGQALILLDKAYLFVDGRYTLQAAMQVDNEAFSFCDWPQTTPISVFEDNGYRDLKIGYDPMLMTVAEFEDFTKLTERNIQFVPLAKNLVDEVWRDRPAPAPQPIRALDLEYTGTSSAEKCLKIADVLQSAGVSAFLSANPEAGNWLMNIRGNDVANTPIALVFTLIHDTGEVELFGDGDGGDIVNISPIEALLSRLGALEGTVGYDRTQCPVAMLNRVHEAQHMADPLIAQKARKTSAELNATRHAHLVDAVAMVKFLAFIDALDKPLTEVQAVETLFDYRLATAKSFQINTDHFTTSFDTISGVNGNGAIIHYRADRKTAASFTRDGVYLVDSGAQYPGATTDITRTVALGAGNSAANRPFTAVLTGLARLSQLRFPKGTKGAQIDAFAREALWQFGMNYAHGTGHGVGAGLSVHEGPAAISPLNQTPLEAGMILSIEPGFYQEGEFGIRLENLVAVREGEDGFLEFETLTFVPIDTRLLDLNRLDDATKDWLNGYHRHIFDMLSPYLDDELVAWLKAKTEPVTFI